MTATCDTVTFDGFEFECGESVPELRVAYETYGDHDGGDVVLVCHVLTTGHHVASSAETADDPGWWDDVVGPGKPIDTDRYFVVCANVPGSCYGTTGPASEHPETGEQYGPRFPPVTVGDWTRVQRRLLDHLGVERLHAAVGGSVGGTNALDWAKRYPDDVDRVAAIAATARFDAQCVALNAVARRAITADPDWQGGDYYGDAHPERGLGLARQLGHVRYLSKESLATKFGREPAECDRDADAPFPPDPGARAFPYRAVESYLDYQAETFVERFDANSYLYLTRAMDEYDLADGHDSDADALADFDGETLVLSFTGDWYCPVAQSDALAGAFREVDVPVAHRTVDSSYGHDAFLTEPEHVGPPLRSFLDEGVPGVEAREVGG